VNRSDFQQLADVRIDEAVVLLGQGKWDGAYYLAGYAVECALKACIAKLTREFDFPDKQRAANAYTHALDALLKQAELETQLKTDWAVNAPLEANWLTVKDWTEASRYLRNAQSSAEQICNAVKSSPDGVLPWIKRYW